MPDNTFIGTWSEKYYSNNNIPKKYFVIEPEAIYKKNIGKFIVQLKEYQKEKGELKQLKIKIEYHYRKRTLDQNSLYWALLQIQANEQNGGQKGPGMITPEDLHNAYLKEYGEREVIKTRRKNLGYYRSKKRVEGIIVDASLIPVDLFINNKDFDNYLPNQYIMIQCIRGTSEYTTKEMAQRIDTVFNEIAFSGVAVTNPGDIHNYWVQWRQHLNDEKIILHDKIMTRKEYKEKNPICEGCGSNQGEQLAHIQAIGMGGKEELEKNHASNWLHLCHECHIDDIHQKGWEIFLKKFPHLSYKVKTALKRDYPIIENEKPELEIF